MLAGLASTPPPIPGALEDDPLTSPSFSLRADTAADSRSYGGSRKHAKTSAPGAPGHAAGHGAGHGNGSGSGGYPPTDYAGAGYAYPAPPPAAPAEQWYSAPPTPAQARTPAYGNPYQHARPGPASSPLGGQGAPDQGGYLADPLRVYSPPAYEPPRYAEPAGPAHPPASVPYADGYSQHPYPDQAGYPDGYSNGYQAGYARDPYAGGGYGPYPSQG
jgi:hypothetical protein